MRGASCSVNSDPEVLRHVHDVPIADEAAALRSIASIPGELPHGFGHWSITLRDGPWIGGFSLRKRHDGVTLMGFRLLREHWGKGYGTNTVAALLKLAFHTYHLDAVVSFLAPGNVGSERVAEKNGGVRWPDAGAYASHGQLHRFERPVG